MTEIKVSGLMGRIKDALGENWFEILQEKIELKRSTIYSWRENDTLPKTRDLYKISQATGESMEFLLTGKNRKDEYSSDEHNLDKKYYDKIQGKDIVNRIDNLLDKKGQTRKALVGAKCVKFLQTITDWKKRNTVLNADVALAIADYFEVSVRYLLTGEYEKNELTLDERNILVSWRNLDKQGQFEVKALLDAKSTPAPAQKTIQAG